MFSRLWRLEKGAGEENWQVMGTSFIKKKRIRFLAYKNSSTCRQKPVIIFCRLNWKSRLQNRLGSGGVVRSGFQLANTKKGKEGADKWEYSKTDKVGEREQDVGYNQMTENYVVENKKRKIKNCGFKAISIIRKYWKRVATDLFCDSTKRKYRMLIEINREQEQMRLQRNLWWNIE